jgi:hypothetical protein
VFGGVDFRGVLILSFSSFSCSFRDFAAFRAFCWPLRFSFF